MSEKVMSSLNILLDSVEGTNLLLEYYSDFSKHLFNVRDFKSIVNIIYEELKKIYVSQKIEIILWHNKNQLLKFEYNDVSKSVTPKEEFSEQNSLYNYVLEKHQAVLTNNYSSFCENMNMDPIDIPANSWLGIPMVVRGKVLGALVIWDGRKNHFLGLQDKQFLTTISDMVSFAIENIYLYDYIVEKNGSLRTFETILPKDISKNSIKTVLLQLQKSVLKQADTVYAGLFLRSQFVNRWRLICEQFEQEEFSSFGLELIKGFTYLTEDIFEKEDFSFWQEGFSIHPLNNALSQPFNNSMANAALFFPFGIDQTYWGVWIIAFSEGEEKDYKDEIHYFQFIFYIISQLLEKRALLERKSKYEVSMKHLDRMKLIGEMAGSTAHHINNILSVILGKAQLLQKKLDHSAYSRDLELILQAAQDGAISINRLQNTISGDETTFNFCPLNFNQIVEEVIEITRPRYEKEAQLKNIHFDLNISLGKTKHVLGDAPALREVLLNLINNALDAMPNGGKLGIQTNQKDDNLLIFISDSGVGIPEENQHKIFEPFFTTKGEKGNGLGLSIVIGIIQKHQGRIYVDSILGKGSIFMIELPVYNETVDLSEPIHNILDNCSYKVLLVEDEGIVRETFAEMLEEKGCEVTAASNAEEAILNFQKYQCDLVFSDLSMPRVNGIELAKKLKKINSQVPIFIITGWNEKDSNLNSFNGLIDGIIHKPFNMEKVEREIAKVFNGKMKDSTFKI
jgi:signal transduction histidine kinase/ActR/RegA family two-component response regulator